MTTNSKDTRRAPEQMVAEELWTFDDPEGEAERRLSEAWEALSKQHRPRKPDYLVQLMVDCYAWPVPDFYPSDWERFRLELRVDSDYERLLEVCRKLSVSLPKSKDSNVLPSLLDTRLPTDGRGGELREVLARIEPLILKVAEIGDLMPRQPRPRPPLVWDVYVRGMVRAIFWYMLRVENEEPTVTFAHRPLVPISRAANLAETTIRAMGRDVSGLKRHMEEVMKDRSWRDEAFGYWDNLPSGQYHPRYDLS